MRYFEEMTNAGTTASLICPACGQAFLIMQRGLEGIAQCPHCAHAAPRTQFGTQAQVAGVALGRRSVAQSQPVQSALQPPPAVVSIPAPDSYATAVHSTPAAISRGTLQHSQALVPVGEPPPVFENQASPHQLRGSPWRAAAVMLAVAAACAVGVWQWWDHANAPAFTPKAALPPIQPDEVRKAEVKTNAVAFDPPDEAACAADAKALITELFAADTPDRRVACVHEGARHAGEIEVWAADKPELRLLAKVPGLPLALPGGRPMPLYKMVTSKCPAGALIRLEEGPDGKRRLHWPTLIETHEAKLAVFLRESTTKDAGWYHVALRPSHGLDIPASLRSKYIVFDAQIAAANDPHLIACVERDSPLGRFMDRESEWGKVYLSRLLVRRLDIDADAPCMVVMDCEGAPER